MRKESSSRSGLALGISGAALALSLVLATPAGAQTLSTVQGHVEGATAGTEVVLTDQNTGQKITVKTDAAGNYTAIGLRPSNYRVETAGKSAQETAVPVGQTVVVDFESTAVAGSNGKDIIITGTRAKETRSASVTTSLSQLQLENLPQNDRNFLNFAALAPGVSLSTDPRSKQIQAGGVSADNVNVFIDGQSFKNQVGHGGVSGQAFSQGNPFPQSAIQEFKVDTQNFKAEYEQAGSAIITAVTKTGGQDWKGGAFVEWQPKSFIGRPYFDRPGKANNPNGTNPKPDYKRWQFGADIGGPLIKDKVTFFFAYEGTRQDNPTKSVTFGAGVPNTIVTANNGSFADPFKQNLYFGKITLFASDKDTFNLSYFRREESDETDYGGIDAREHGRNLDTGSQLFQFEYNRRGDSFLNEFSVSYYKSRTGTPALTVGPEIVLTNNGGDVAHLGGHFFTQNSAQKTLTIKNNFTYTGLDNNVIKFGAKLAINKYTRAENWFVNGSYYFNAPTYTTFNAGIPTRATISTKPASPSMDNNTQIGLFLQDDWTIDNHWTVNVGIRWDYESNMVNNKFVTPANVVTALNAYQGWKAAGINPADYISTGNNRKPFYGAFQPRLGISYDVNGDRRLVFFAGAGRYYDRSLYGTAQIERQVTAIRSESTVNFCGAAGLPACGPGLVQWNSSYLDPANLRTLVQGLGTGGSVWLLNNKTKVPYSDEFDIGVRKKFGQVNVSLTYSHIESYNIFKYVRGNRMPDGSFPTTTGPSYPGQFVIVDNFPLAGQLPGFNGKLNIGDSSGRAAYNAVYLTIDKPFTKASGWGVTGTLTIQSARSNSGTEIAADEFFAGPDQKMFGWQNVQGVAKYQFVGTAIAALPWGITGSATLTLSSGPAFGNVVFNPDGIVFNGAGVFFPKETFAYSNLDLRIQKTFKMPWGNELSFDAEVFNVFDTVNRSFSTWGSGSGSSPSFLENGTVGNARSFQVGAKYRF